MASGKTRTGNVRDPELNKKLFNQYVVPRFASIRSLVFKYINKKSDTDEYFNLVLTELYKYIHTYKPEKSIDTWLHIVTKRAVYNRNKKDYEYAQLRSGVFNGNFDFDGENTIDDNLLICNKAVVDNGKLLDNLSDEVIQALSDIPASYLSAFLLYYQDYKVEEIVKIEYKRGYIDSTAPEAKFAIFNRIYEAKRALQEKLKEHGITRTKTKR